MLLGAPVVSTVKSSLWPVCFEKSAPTSRKGSCMEPPTRSFSCAASAGKAARINAAARKDGFSMMISLTSFDDRFDARRFEFRPRSRAGHEDKKRARANRYRSRRRKPTV